MTRSTPAVLFFVWAGSLLLAYTALPTTVSPALGQTPAKPRKIRPQTKADKVITFRNLWTKEIFVVGTESTTQVPKTALQSFFQCHFTGDRIRIQPKLVALSVAAARHFKKTEIHMISGYRSSKYNLMLRKKGRQVARNSQHTLGRAIDIRIPGVSTKALRTWLRKHHKGGVGYYPNSGFVHIDVGLKRSWTGS